MDQEVKRMSRKEFSVAYDGPERADDHTIDVDVLAPALLAFGKLIRESNKEVNGKVATAKVLVVSDFEHKCFNINFDVVLSFYEQVRQLLVQQDVKSAKDILEWIGLIGSGATGTLSYLGFLKWRRGRKIESVTKLVDKDQSGMVRVQIEGEKNSVTIHNHTWNLANNPKALTAARDAFAPIGSDGFEVMVLRDGSKTVEKIQKDEADAILLSCVAGIEEATDVTPVFDETTVWLTVYSPVYEAKAGTWRFRLGKEVIYADITQTTIAQDALTRGGAMVDDSYQVKIESETRRSPTGKLRKPTYKVLEVLRFLPAQHYTQDEFPGL